jgi:hypothetical protein
VGPITLGDITYRTDVALGFAEARASYHINVPLTGWLESRHRGVQMSPSPAVAAIYRPDGEITVNRWPGGTRNLAVKIDQVALERALESLVDGPVDSPIPVTAELPLKSNAAQSWVRLLLMVQRHLDRPDSVLGHSVVSVPLVESLIHGFLLVADHPYREQLAAPAGSGRPAALRHAMDIVETGAHLPLTNLDTRSAMPRQRAHAAGGVPPALGHVADGVCPRGQTPPGPPGSSVGRSHAQHRRRYRASLGVHPPRPVSRGAQNGVRRDTAASPARCALT